MVNGGGGRGAAAQNKGENTRRGPRQPRGSKYIFHSVEALQWNRFTSRSWKILFAVLMPLTRGGSVNAHQILSQPFAIKNLPDVCVWGGLLSPIVVVMGGG